MIPYCASTPLLSDNLQPLVKSLEVKEKEQCKMKRSTAHRKEAAKLSTTDGLIFSTPRHLQQGPCRLPLTSAKPLIASTSSTWGKEFISSPMSVSFIQARWLYQIASFLPLAAMYGAPEHRLVLRARCARSRLRRHFRMIGAEAPGSDFRPLVKGIRRDSDDRFPSVTYLRYEWIMHDMHACEICRPTNLFPAAHSLTDSLT